MGLIYRCPHCVEPMVLESFHSGREVPCPSCAERLDVPPHLDFERISAATRRDAATGKVLLSLAFAFAVMPFFPISALVWWYASGRIDKALEEEREVDPLMRLARAVARAGTVLGGILVLVLLPRLFG
jgi:DNA-directed RNA polymerase subunit RPC12/RpoP